jgi:uncharacterized RmlC-like cupin family protein
VDQLAGCAVVRSEQGGYQGRQDVAYSTGISAQSVGSRALCLHTLTIPPGGRAKAHLHENHESAIYVLSGRAEMFYGENLARHLVAGPGDFVYIPAGVPHLPINTGSEPVVGVVARTDPNEQESVVLLPELDKLVNGDRNTERGRGGWAPGEE